MPEKNRPRIVLIEDHTMVRQLLAHLVRDELGLNLVADCTNVADGHLALTREKPDLAIVDWMLPDGRGFDLVRRAGPKLSRTRWLFISSTLFSNVSNSFTLSMSYGISAKEGKTLFRPLPFGSDKRTISSKCLRNFSFTKSFD